MIGKFLSIIIAMGYIGFNDVFIETIELLATEKSILKALCCSPNCMNMTTLNQTIIPTHAYTGKNGVLFLTCFCVLLLILHI